MRARTQIAIPEPKGSEFDNFDRMAGILLQVKPAVYVTFENCHITLAEDIVIDGGV